MLDIGASYHFMQFQGKRMIETIILGVISTRWTQIRTTMFFFQKSGFQLLSRTLSEKNNDPIFRKLSDWRTHGQTDGRIDFIGRCPTNIERPIKLYTPWNPNMLPKYFLSCIFLLLPISLNVNYNSWLF